MYFNSTAETVINHKFGLDKSLHKILQRINNCINEGSGWIVQLIKSHYINISTHRPLSGSFYIKLPAELRSPKKSLIKIKNNDQKYFIWCHVMHINSGKIHAERITQKVKELLNDLNYDGIKSPVSKEDFSKIAGLKIMVGHQTMSDQNQKLSDKMEITPDILSCRKNLR